jgi:hypothetical protein
MTTTNGTTHTPTDLPDSPVVKAVDLMARVEAIGSTLDRFAITMGNRWYDAFGADWTAQKYDASWFKDREVAEDVANFLNARAANRGASDGVGTNVSSSREACNRAWMRGGEVKCICGECGVNTLADRVAAADKARDDAGTDRLLADVLAPIGEALRRYYSPTDAETAKRAAKACRDSVNEALIDLDDAIK